MLDYKMCLGLLLVTREKGKGGKKSTVPSKMYEDEWKGYLGIGLESGSKSNRVTKKGLSKLLR